MITDFFFKNHHNQDKPEYFEILTTPNKLSTGENNQALSRTAQSAECYPLAIIPKAALYYIWLTGDVSREGVASI